MHPGGIPPAGPTHPACGHSPLTTTRMCLAKSLELPIRKSEKAVCGRQRASPSGNRACPSRCRTGVLRPGGHGWVGAWVGERVGVATARRSSRPRTHPGVEHLIPEAAVELLRVGLWVVTRNRGQSAALSLLGLSNLGLGGMADDGRKPCTGRGKVWPSRGPSWAPPRPPPPAGGLLSKDAPTSRLVELQGDVGVKAQAEVVVEDIQRQLEEGQGTGMRGSRMHPAPPHSHLCRKGALAQPSQLPGSPVSACTPKWPMPSWLLFPGLARPPTHDSSLTGLTRARPWLCVLLRTSGAWL